MQTKKIKIRGKAYEAEVCDSIFSKFRGLMFRKRSKTLLFRFKKPTRQPIHSLFCKPFRAIWLLNGRIIDDKIVKPFRISIKPKEKFSEIVEIPLENYNK